MNLKQLKRSQGFTLMEIMVVLVIIGLLVGVVAPNIMGQLEKAKIETAYRDINTISSLLDSYKIDNNRYPTTEQGLQALVTKPDIDPVPRRYLPGGYTKKINRDPWDNEYVLISPNDSGGFDLYSFGPDGVDGTEDDISNNDEIEE